MSNYSYPDLVNAAKQALKNAYTLLNHENDPRFGAAVLTTQGNIYASGQYLSNTLSLSLHAEQAALVHAAAHGEYGIVAITCIGNEAAYLMSGGRIYPCHFCKQLLWESYLKSDVNTEILIIDISGNLLEQCSIHEIMNYPWPLKASF